MNTTFLGNILWSLSSGNGFQIKGAVNTEEDYDSYVVYSDPSKKPSWSDIQTGKIPEKWKLVRLERDNKLRASDWAVLPDVPMEPSKRSEWETYRQALRDITTQPDPFNITWPTPPA